MPARCKKISKLIAEHERQKEEIEQEKLKLFEKSLESIAKDKDYFDILEKLSVKLQRRIAGILRVLEFNESNSNRILLKAISNFIDKDTRITSTAPTDFLEEEEKDVLTDDNKAVNPQKSHLYS